MAKRVIVERADHIATVTLDREDKRNAVDLQMFAELIEAAATLGSDPSLRAVVLTGKGDHFCAGIDISVFQGAGIGESGAGRMDPLESSPANFFQGAAYAWRELPVPVIAALQGTVFGAGLQIAMGADIRFAAADVRMSIMEVKWGLIPDMAISTTLRHVVATDKVRELAYTGRIVTGAEAAALGLVTAIKDDPLQAACATAQEIATKSPDAIRAVKKLINESWQADPAAALRQEARLQMAVMAGENQKEAVLANLEKRMPQFVDPNV